MPRLVQRGTRWRSVKFAVAVASSSLLSSNRKMARFELSRARFLTRYVRPVALPDALNICSKLQASFLLVLNTVAGERIELCAKPTSRDRSADGPPVEKPMISKLSHLNHAQERASEQREQWMTNSRIVTSRAKTHKLRAFDQSRLCR